MGSLEKSKIDSLISFREFEFENCLKLGAVALEILEKYKFLAENCSVQNPIAKNLPKFSMSLLDEFGSIGAIEFAVRNELINSSKLSIDKEA